MLPRRLRCAARRRCLGRRQDDRVYQAIRHADRRLRQLRQRRSHRLGRALGAGARLQRRLVEQHQVPRNDSRRHQDRQRHRREALFLYHHPDACGASQRRDPLYALPHLARRPGKGNGRLQRPRSRPPQRLICEKLVEDERAQGVKFVDVTVDWWKTHPKIDQQVIDLIKIVQH